MAGGVEGLQHVFNADHARLKHSRSALTDVFTKPLRGIRNIDLTKRAAFNEAAFASIPPNVRRHLQKVAIA